MFKYIFSCALILTSFTAYAGKNNLAQHNEGAGSSSPAKRAVPQTKSQKVLSGYMQLTLDKESERKVSTMMTHIVLEILHDEHLGEVFLNHINANLEDGQDLIFNRQYEFLNDMPVIGQTFMQLMTQQKTINVHLQTSTVATRPWFLMKGKLNA